MRIVLRERAHTCVHGAAYLDNGLYLSNFLLGEQAGVLWARSGGGQVKQVGFAGVGNHQVAELFGS